MYLLRLFEMMGLPLPMALGMTIGTIEQDTSETEMACEDAVVFISPTDVNFTHDGDVEAVSVFAFHAFGGGPLELDLTIRYNGGTTVATYAVDQSDTFCDGGMIVAGRGGAGSTCHLTVDNDNMPVIPIVYHPSALGADDVGWITATYTDSYGNVCESGRAMLDGHAIQ